MKLRKPVVNWLPVVFFCGGVLATSPLEAACSCSISASVFQPDLTLTSTSSGACERLTGMGFFVDGGFVGSSAQFSVSTWTATITTTSACLKSGNHLATSTCRCGEIIPVDFCADTSGSASTSFAVNSTPTVSVSADGPNVLGQVQLSVPYNFPNTIANIQHQLAVRLDGVEGQGVSSSTVSGTWTPLLETSCLSNGSHQVRVHATACKMLDDPAFLAEAQTTVQVDHQPTVTLTLVPDDPAHPEGLQQAQMAYSFPQTVANVQRSLVLKGYPQEQVLGSFRPAFNQGVATMLVGCIPNSLTAVVAVATACGDSQDQDGAALPGCPKLPKKDRCDEGQCCTGPGGGAPPWGGGTGGPGGGGPPTGPGARLHYLAGGVGNLGNPGRAAWNAILGRNWSHDYAERIVPDGSVARRVWLLTRFGSFRQLDDIDNDGLYEKVSPEDEYRTLSKVGAGWQLRDLEGTVDVFDSSGLWQSRTDRHGNAKTATYSAGRLARVTMPDGRSETFAYDPTTGKLATITEVGVGGAGQRVWRYTWSGLDLVAIDRPDGTGLRFVYGDPRLPGYLTRWILVGADNSDPGTPRPERVELAYEFDGLGNARRAWRGSDAFATGVDRYEMAYDNPFEPTKTTVTIHRSATERDTVVYTFSRTAAGVGAKPRTTSITGDCPSYGLAPSTTLFYDDPANRLRPTRTIDGRGIETQFVYDAHGQVTQKTEAAGTPLVRTTTWTYNSLYPALPTRIETPSTSSGSTRRVTVLSYDGQGNLTSRRIQGVEAGSFFDFETATSFNAAGQPLTIDPPGYGGEDRTSFTYDAARGGLLPRTRTDPLVGAIAFEYDPFNQRISVVDPNDVRTETSYDTLNRVLSVTQKGAATAEDLVTAHEYDSFGDLLRTTLPRGNVVEYGRDSSGRLISIARKPDTAMPGERTLYTLDLLGNRIKEELQRWDGTLWVTESFTDYLYVNRCQIGKVVHAGTATTEYAYNCDGNLEKVWDANHPKATNPNPTQLYTYDSLNRLSSLTQPWTGTGGTTAVTSYAYDVQDHLSAVTDAEGNTARYVYGDRDLMTAEESAVSGITTTVYNEHGEPVEETDSRPVTLSRTFDALDRLTFVDYPDDSLDTTYNYDDPSVPFSKGRLTRIDRDATAIAYTYDPFGRLLQDGALTYSYDRNGNLETLEYPNGLIARYTYDFADRQSTLQVQDGIGPPQTLVAGSSYKPFGPLASLTLGNGLTETHAFDARYLPTAISVPGRLSWSYSTDAVGNPTGVTDALNPANNRAYAYQDPQYFLITGNGPWGTRSWSYDKIGSRLTETRGTVTDTYIYVSNGAGGHNPRLERIERGGESTVTYSYDATGDVLANGMVPLTYGDDRRLAQTGSRVAQTSYLYDGRGLLSESTYLAVPGWMSTTGPTYSSDGRLFHRYASQRRFPTVGLQSNLYVFYFSGRPVATFEKLVDGGSTLQYLTTDHLGTPILVTDSSGAKLWEGGFEPFGTDFSSSPTPLRFPGQWVDLTWAGTGLYYNVNRWYEPGTGRYSQPDPLELQGSLHLFAYADLNPIRLVDPLGLKVELYCQRVGQDPGAGLAHEAAGAAGFHHCFVRVRCDCPKYDRRLEVTGINDDTGMAEIPEPPNFASGHGATIVPFDPPDWDSKDCSMENCIMRRYRELQQSGYPYGRRPRGYLFGPNSNTFANDLLTSCGARRISWPPGVTPFTN